MTEDARKRGRGANVGVDRFTATEWNPREIVCSKRFSQDWNELQNMDVLRKSVGILMRDEARYPLEMGMTAW